MKRKIEVTEIDIRKGEPSDVNTCPVARAINRTLRIVNTHVGGDFTCFRFNDADFEIYLPKWVMRWIRRFDDEEKVEPFTFVLRGGND